MSLYFIALIPEADLEEKIKKIKEEISEKYEAKHALKLPAHITMVIPFKLKDKHEPVLLKTLEKFAEGRSSFQLQLYGFDSFPPRVIFVKLKDLKPVIKFYDQLKQSIKEIIPFLKDDEREIFHPHITVATRDLTRENYKEAWPHFKDRSFNGNWEVASFYLLKHNGRNWDTYREFPLGK